MPTVAVIVREAWSLLCEASVYILFGLIVSGLLRVFLDPSSVAKHLGLGRVRSVLKAALLGIPIPLCSCGVLPAAVSLKKQGANNGATTAFLIATPESGIDSIAVTYALIDPVMTLARPLAAFTTAATAGIVENVLPKDHKETPPSPDLTCTVDACCDGTGCATEEHRRHHNPAEKLMAGCRHAFSKVWGDMASWFFAGLVLSGLITALVPSEILGRYLGGGPWAMVFMLALATPLYICATASTPIAAALIMKGVSPGAALVFLLAGPATNITTLTVLFGLLGKRATAIYLSTIIVLSLVFGLILDKIYVSLGLSATAMAGQAAEIVPQWAGITGALILLLLSVRPLSNTTASYVDKLAKSVNHYSRQGENPDKASRSGDEAAPL
ncbi:SO_0444 family Cu/Zn efflux transporter [Thermodesulfobacteriota bacterium]